MQGYRVERTVRDTLSFRISSPNMLVAWLGLAFVRWTKFCYFLTYVQSIPFGIHTSACLQMLVPSNFAELHVLSTSSLTSHEKR